LNLGSNGLPVLGMTALYFHIFFTVATLVVAERQKP
jgi:hypothetical protein